MRPLGRACCHPNPMPAERSVAADRWRTDGPPHRPNSLTARSCQSGEDRWNVALEIRLFRTPGKLPRAAERFWNAVTQAARSGPDLRAV
jgi:hypothetical protein